MKAIASVSPDLLALDDEDEQPSPGRRTRTMRIQRRGATAAPSEAPPEIESYLASSRGGGGRLRGAVLQKMNDAFGHDFKNVGIHTDSAAADAARALGAHAFTFGADVYFASGKFEPDTGAGQSLLGHELAHVVQQGGAARVQAKLVIGGDDDAAEREADALGERAAAGPTLQRSPAVSASAPMIRLTPADVSFGKRDTSIVGSVPDLVKSHIATDVNVSSSAAWDWIWKSRWIVYDASDMVVDQSEHRKHPDYTLTPATVKKGVPSDGGANKWTVRFETTETGKPFGGDSADNFPWDQSRFHVYSSPISDPHFAGTNERGNQLLVSDSLVPAEDGASYKLQISGTETRTDDSNVTVTKSVKLSGGGEAGVGFEYEGVSGGLKNKVNFEAQQQIAKSAGKTISASQTIARTFSQNNLKKGKKYEFRVYPSFVVLSGKAGVLAQNLGVVSSKDDATGSVRIWTGYELETKDNASHDSNDDAKAPWKKAAAQQGALDALGGGTATRAQRDLLIEEIKRQVPDVAYMEQVKAGAKTVLNLIIPGNGPLGIKTLNDDLVGYQINNSMIAPQRNAAVTNAFTKGDGKGPMPFTVTEVTYKSATVTSKLPPKDLRGAMKTVLAVIDRDIKTVYLNGLTFGLDHWKKERDRTPEDTDEHREADRRVKNIEKAIELVKSPDFVFDFQFGMAAIERGPGGGTPDYESAATSKLHASEAALMSRDPDQGRDPDTDVGDARGQIYDKSVFVKFAEKGEKLREQVISSGNTLTHHGHQYRVFVGAEANRDVLRDVRKGKVTDKDVLPGEVETLHLFQKYFVHVNAFDNIREFTSKELDKVGEQIKRAQKLVDSLKGEGPVDVKAVTDTLHQNPGMGQVLPTTGTASEAVWYNAESHKVNRIIVSCDIKDMGVDLVQHYGKAMHRVGKKGENPDTVAQQASDPMVLFRRQAVQKLRVRYQAIIKEAIADAEKKGDAELVKQLKAEVEPSVLMGGDEITLSVHGALRPYVGKLAAALSDPNVTRARVAISTTGSDPTKAVDDHIVAMQRADPAHSVLKQFESAQREMEITVEEIPNPERKKEGAALVAGLGIDLLYAENEGEGIILRRNDTNAVVDADELRGRIEKVKKRLRELKDQK